MNRRLYLLGVAGALGLGGCTFESGTSSSATPTPPPVSKPREIASYEFTHPIKYGEDLERLSDPDIPPGPPRITAICPEERTLNITGGMDISGTPCDSSQLKSLTMDGETLNIGIYVEQVRNNGKPCPDAAGPNPYRLNLTFASALPKEIFIFQTNGRQTNKKLLNVSK